MKKNKLKTIDLFSGCGGLIEGFESSGSFSTLGLVEWDSPSLKTLANRLKTKWNYNNTDDLAIHFDMQRTDELLNGWKSDHRYNSHKGLRALVKEQGGKVDVIVGGPPCQAYSVAGRIRDKNGMQNDYRNYLFETYLAVVKEFQPKVFIFENVLGLLSAKPNGIQISEIIQKSFNDIGYYITEDLKKAIVDASDYGVPQNRKRLIIVGLRKKYFKGDFKQILSDFYNNILPKFKTEKKSVRNAIYDLPKIRVTNDGKKSHQMVGRSKITNHIPRYHSVRDIEIFKELALDLTRKNKKYNTIDDLKRLYTEKTGKKSNIHKYYVLKPDEPSNTIVAHLHKDGLRHIHPDPQQARSITPREAARLQSFPDDFEFLGSMGDQYKMIGNAVPPKLAERVALSLNELLQKYTT